MLKKVIFNKILVVVLHLSGWAIIFSFPLLFLFTRGDVYMTGDREILRRQDMFTPDSVVTRAGRPSPGIIRLDPQRMIVESVLVNIMLASFFYLNVYFLVPSILSRRGWLWYGLCILGAFFLFLAGSYLLRFISRPDGIAFGPPFFFRTENFWLIFALSLALRLVQDRGKIERERKEMETEGLKSELSFLRSQVSPHFMFNVLNSLASLARKRSDKLENAIIQLSQLMRYSLYNNDHKKVSIEKEVEYLRNYIDLQKLRFPEAIHINSNFQVERKELEIEPMLLIPFVENAFKHGVGVTEPMIIVILHVSTYQLNFTVRNKFNGDGTEVKDTTSGIGLQNIKRRLDLLYKDLYELNIDRTNDNWFIAELKLILQ